MAEQIHPINRFRGYYFELPPMREFKESFKELNSFGEPALLCIGKPRHGKSTLCHHLFEMTRDAPKAKVASFHAIADKTRFAQLGRDLRASRGASPFLSGNEQATLINAAMELADKLETERVLLLIDEAHLLSADQYLGLMNVTENLASRKLSCMVALFAHPEILTLNTRISNLGRNQAIYDRYFLRQVPLRGLRMSEISLFLKSFDTARFPASGPTFTEHFLPTAWAQGWRLESLTENFVQAFEDQVGPDGSHRETAEIGVKYLAAAAVYVLRNWEKLRARGESARTIVTGAAESSGLVQAYQLARSAAEYMNTGSTNRGRRAGR